MTLASIKYFFGFIFVLLITGGLSSTNSQTHISKQDQEIKQLSDSIDYYKAKSHMFLELARIRVDSAVARADRK